MDATATRVGDVVEGLVVLGRSVLSGVTVSDGPNPGDDLGDDVLMVGVGNEEDADPFRTTRTGFDLGGRARESGTIRCQMSTWSGGTDLAGMRTRLAVWMASLETAIRSDQQLSGTCDVIRLGSARWFHLQRPEGAGVGVHFDVNYEAWI